MCFCWGRVLEVQVRYTNFSLHLWVKTCSGDYIMGFSTVLNEHYFTEGAAEGRGWLKSTGGGRGWLKSRDPTGGRNGYGLGRMYMYFVLEPAIYPEVSNQVT